MDNFIAFAFWREGRIIEQWVEFYNDVKKLFDTMGYRLSHIGIVSTSYTKGKVMTVERKEKEILSKLTEGEIPKDFGCYSLPPNYKIAAFDYNIFVSRSEDVICVTIREKDYNEKTEVLIEKFASQYIAYEKGEIFSTATTEVPDLYAYTMKKENLETFRHVKNIINSNGHID